MNILAAELRFKIESLIEYSDRLKQDTLVLISKKTNESTDNSYFLSNNTQYNEIPEESFERSHSNSKLEKELANSQINELKRKIERLTFHISNKESNYNKLKEEHDKLKILYDSQIKKMNKTNNETVDAKRYLNLIQKEFKISSESVILLNESSNSLQNELSKLRLEQNKSNDIINKQINHKEKLSSEIDNLNKYISELQISLKNEKASSYLNQSTIINFNLKYENQVKRFNKLDAKNKLNLQQIDKLNQSNTQYKEELLSINKSLQLTVASINQAAEDNIELRRQHELEVLKFKKKLEKYEVLKSNNSSAFPVSPDNNNNNNNNNNRENQSVIEDSSNIKFIEMSVKNFSNKNCKIGNEDDEKSKFNGNLLELNFSSNINTNLISNFDKFNSNQINKNVSMNKEIIETEFIKEEIINKEKKLNELNPETCYFCYEDAYGLMAICNSCKKEFHSSCAKKQKKQMGKETDSFICINCNNS